jgi:hypothetical protein
MYEPINQKLIIMKKVIFVTILSALVSLTTYAATVDFNGNDKKKKKGKKECCSTTEEKKCCDKKSGDKPADEKAK